MIQLQFSTYDMLVALKAAGYQVRHELRVITYPCSQTDGGFAEKTIDARTVYRNGQIIYHEWNERSEPEEQLKEIFADELSRRILQKLF